MSTLVWRAPMRYFSPGDKAAFFAWLQAVPGVLSVRGVGRELHITLRSKRLSAQALRELLALYRRYGGNMRELAVFANPSNEGWLTKRAMRTGTARCLAPVLPPNPSFERSATSTLRVLEPSAQLQR